MYICITHLKWQTTRKKILHNRTDRNCIARFRLSSHKQVDIYGANRIPREERICQICNSNDIEDEFHCVCNSYSNIWSLYITQYYNRRPSMFTLIELLRTEKKSELIGLGKYMYYATKHRIESLNAL
jgi:hypothetical protein